MDDNFKKIMIFGVFDRLHDGHKFLIEKAQNYGNMLYIVVASTKNTKLIKGKPPFYSILERTKALQKAYPEANIIEGDEESNAWSPIQKYHPDIIICGYDQDDLYNTLLKIKDKYQFELTKIAENTGGEEMHSRFLNKGV